AQFSWLVMSKPINEAMLLGDDAIPDAAAIAEHAATSAHLFVAAHRPSRRLRAAGPTRRRRP
ncbi:MAG: hypothetical protein ACRCSN_04660, partial [Dermatophilaceae bacterium]